MRTTLTLDDDVAALLARTRQARKTGLKETINEAQNVAWATATNIMGRESAYSGAEVKWADMYENPNHALYNLAMKPSADDFEKGGEIELPKDGDIRIPGKA